MVVHVEQKGIGTVFYSVLRRMKGLEKWYRNASLCMDEW